MITRLLQGAQVASVVMAGIDLGLFAAMADQSRSAAEIARTIACPERSTIMVLRALVDVGLVEVRDDRYRLTREAAAELVPGAPRYVGDAARLYADPILLRAYADLPAAVRNGGSVLEEDAEAPSHPFWTTFARASAEPSRNAADVLALALDDWLAARGRVRVLDVACGSGAYGARLAEREGVEATLLDGRSVLDEARRNVGDRSRVRFLAGDLFEVDWPESDLVLASFLLHHFDLERCAQLVAKAAKALTPGGRLVIHDYLAERRGAGLFSLTMLLFTRRGEPHTTAEYTRVCEQSGLRVVRSFESAGLPSSFLIAEKIA